MGYSTYIIIHVVHQRSLNLRWENNAFRKIVEHANPCMLCMNSDDEAEFSDNNCNILQEVIRMSEKFPSLIMEASGDGEEKGDLWHMRIKNGKTEDLTASVIYPVFKTILTHEERVSARWKASRRSKCTEGKPYDKRVVKALRLIRDLVDNPPECNLIGIERRKYMRVNLAPALSLLEEVKRSMLQTEETKGEEVCPHCGSPNIECLVEDDHCGTPWHCHQCDTWFERPNKK